MMPTTPATRTNIQRSVDASELRRLLERESDIRVLDVRSVREYDSIHIAGSYNAPLDTLVTHAREIAELDHPIVLVCKTGGRAEQARAVLADAGKVNLSVLDGGLDSWLHNGDEVERGASQVWAMDRQVRLVAGSISLVGIAGSLVFPKAKWLAGAVAAGLTYSAVSNTCAMGNALARLPYNRGRGCDIEAVLADMRAGS